MNCLLAAATANEIAPFINDYRLAGNKQDIDILVTGIGLTAATYGLVKQLSIKRPDLILQAGIAGSFDRNIPPGSVVVIKHEVIADQMVIENKQIKTMFDLGLVRADHFPFQKGRLVNPYAELIRQTGLKPVNAISVNQVTTAKQMIGLYQEKFKPAVESMEGGALHFVALSEKIPFLQIRSISNYMW